MRVRVRSGLGRETVMYLTSHNHAAVQMTKKWRNVAKEVSVIGPIMQVDQPIPDDKSTGGDGGGIVSTVEISQSILKQ